ncbi:hypothetical protein [Streptomyces decoyicus]|uniref:hypothetical protein n=1 Tax=Streptomyces decoyicus TaxID=249567 RepID=UPI0033A2387E
MVRQIATHYAEWAFARRLPGRDSVLATLQLPCTACMLQVDQRQAVTGPPAAKPKRMFSR